LDERDHLLHLAHDMRHDSRSGSSSRARPARVGSSRPWRRRSGKGCHPALRWLTVLNARPVGGPSGTLTDRAAVRSRLRDARSPAAATRPSALRSRSRPRGSGEADARPRVQGRGRRRRVGEVRRR
jgi:hypothetical protein